jgi:hypothetical protein
MSTRTVADKLLIKPNTTVYVSPAEHFGLVGPLPEGVRTVAKLEQATTALIVVDDASSARKALDAHNGQLKSPAVLWVAYPKGNKTDINRDTLWPIVTEFGLRPIGQVAVDDVWSALRFRAMKEGEAPFTGGGGQ